MLEIVANVCLWECVCVSLDRLGDIGWKIREFSYNIAEVCRVILLTYGCKLEFDIHEWWLKKFLCKIDIASVVTVV